MCDLHIDKATLQLPGEGARRAIHVRRAAIQFPAVVVIVQQDEAIELTSGWRDLEADKVYLVPMRYKQIGAHHYLIPVGEFTGALGLRVKLIK